MAKYYFTFGTDKCYPHKGGWVEITAPTKLLAEAAFDYIYPSKRAHDCFYVYRYAECYNEVTFLATKMAKKGNHNAFCHRKFEVDITEGGVHYVKEATL